MQIGNYLVSVLVSVWPSSWLKAYDCSGFAWRALLDAGVLLKRTTARKLFYLLPAAAGAPDRSRFGTLVFFDQVHHVGIVRSDREFYHASTSHGTRREEFGPYWRRRVSGYRQLRE